MAPPLIGITCSTSAFDSSAPQAQERLNRTYANALSGAGAAPLLIPNLADPELRAAYLAGLDGILLSGGWDIDPRLYGEEARFDTVKVDEPRDCAELPLIRDALAREMPVLAICRGVQALNVALGGSLFQDLPAQRPSEIAHVQPEARCMATHDIQIDGDSLLGRAVGRAMRVNSFHHQALKQIGRGLRVVARAPDGVIEAVEAPNAGFVLGVQFHPEELVGVCGQARRLFRAFVEATASR
jgi:putative glutamine amidotransferase